MILRRVLFVGGVSFFVGENFWEDGFENLADFYGLELFADSEVVCCAVEVFLDGGEHVT